MASDRLCSIRKKALTTFCVQQQLLKNYVKRRSEISPALSSQKPMDLNQFH